MSHPEPRTALIANPGFDLYGSDLQMLESVASLRQRGWRVVVSSPAPGPLADRLSALGAETTVFNYPVLRRADAGPRGLLHLGVAAMRALPRMRRLIKSTGADVVYVNTVTLPWWLAAARLSRRPSVCHVHEAEPTVRTAIQRTMAAPLLLADIVVANSRVCEETLRGAAPQLRRRISLVYNGVRPPPEQPGEAALRPEVTRLVYVGRLSPRKAPHHALEATALLRSRGRDVHLEVCGSALPIHRDYHETLLRRAQEDDLAGAVTFSGYTQPVWPALARSDIFLATSTAEPFGNAVVEAQLAQRPVIATALEGHLETVIDGTTGIHVPPGRADAFAAAVERIVDAPDFGRQLAQRARERALEEFGPEQYGRSISELLERLASSPTKRRRNEVRAGN